MSEFISLFNRLMVALEAPGLNIPTTGVKFFHQDTPIPFKVQDYAPSKLTLTSCQAAKQAGLGDPVLLTVDNIGCIAAAISLGLVDQHQTHPLSGPRIYTNIMHQQSDRGNDFLAPTPKDFTDGIVYACKSAGRPDFCLFGTRDQGRFKNQNIARNAVAEMMAIQPAIMRGVFLYPPDFTDLEFVPDVVVMSIRPVELTRIIQAHQYNTGKRLEASMGGLRAVNSDLIVRPYLTQQINISPYCLGARLIARYEANRLGIGIPYTEFCVLVEGMEASQGGYPFSEYPGATDSDDG
ncbi:conserved hypothetical protein [Gammaproteobacteria bacterium]